MKVKLKTAKQLVKEFGFEYDGHDYTTIFNGMYWCINDLMFEYLGEEIEIEELDEGYNSYMESFYTHRDLNIKYLWHESWFEPNDFFKEDEFEL